MVYEHMYEFRSIHDIPSQCLIFPMNNSMWGHLNHVLELMAADYLHLENPNYFVKYAATSPSWAREGGLARRALAHFGRLGTARLSA